MIYYCYERTAAGIHPREFLAQSAKQYLENCEQEIFDVFNERISHSSDVSLANTLSRTIKRRFDDRVIRLDDAITSEYGVAAFFQHRNATEGVFLELFKEAAASNISDFLIITQTKEFKTKFNFDRSTMTFETVTEDFDEFVSVLQPQRQLRLFFPVFAELAFETSIQKRGEKSILQIHSLV